MGYDFMPREHAEHHVELTQASSSGGARWRLGAKLGVGLTAIALAAWLGRDLSHHLVDFETWVGRQGVDAYLIYIAVLIVGTSLFIPDTLFALIAGALFGVPLGTVLMSVGCILTAATDYFLARYLLHDTVRKLLDRSPRLRAIERAVHGEGLRFQLLLRLVPLHPVTVSYVLGASKVRFSTFIVGCVAMIPWIFVEVYLGYVAKHAALASGQKNRPSLAESALTVMGLVLCLAILIYIVRIARRALSEYERSAAPTP